MIVTDHRLWVGTFPTRTFNPRCLHLMVQALRGAYPSVIQCKVRTSFPLAQFAAEYDLQALQQALCRDVWIAAIASSRTSLVTLSVVMCNTSQCKLRSLRVNFGMLNVICIVTYYTLPPLSPFTMERVLERFRCRLCTRLIVESNYEPMTREPPKNCKKAFYDIFLLYHI